MTLGLPDPSQVGRIVREVARTEIMPRFRNLAAHEVSHKRHPRDLVTIADVESERRLTELLTPLVPGCAFVGEEAADADPGIFAALADEAPVWLLDPVDGTTNFATGKPCFAVIVAYCVQGEALAGWIYDPLADVVLWAMANGGAWLDDGSGGQQRARATSERDIGKMTGSLGPRAADRLSGAVAARGWRQPPRIVRYGSAGREYMDLGTGALHFANYVRLKPWDHAAGVLIHREAGGFSAMRCDRSRYHCAPHIVEDALLLAPDEATWQYLNRLLD
jgi:fructose-1,6-bisphosphatase/inositol monophosphatase family enzyme